MAFSDIFKNSSDYNEKTIIGFLAFAVMTIFALADVGTGIFGMKLEVQDFIYHGFELITLGSFGIAGLEKFSPTEKVKAEASAAADAGLPDPE
jgi:hypothetical protein